ncbi:MAG: hypothetical protein Kow0092_37220 [Deferrisomatales bacterium]
MKELIGGALVGVFVGAFAVEVLHRVKPDLAEKIEEKAAAAAEKLVSAFQEGYAPEEGEPEPV